MTARSRLSATRDPTRIEAVVSAPVPLGAGAGTGPIVKVGTRWYDGSGVPSGALGIVNDFYLDNDTRNYYEKTGAGTWTLRGALSGSVWLSGAIDPTGSVGRQGDWYFNTTTRDAFEKTGPTTWTLRANFAALNDDSVTNAKLRNSAGVSVIGRGANSVGDPADIVAGGDGLYLLRRGGALLFSNPLYSEMLGGGAFTLVGNPTGSAGAPLQAVPPASGLAFRSGSLGLADQLDQTFLANNGGVTGAPTGVPAATAAAMLRAGADQGKALRLAAQPAYGQRCLLADYGIELGTVPVTNNAAIINGRFALATGGDTFVLPSASTPGAVGITTLYTQPSAIPSNCTLEGAHAGCSASGIMRSYAVSDFRDPFIRMGREGCVARNFVIYLDNQGPSSANPVKYSSGYGIGYRAATSSEFIISGSIQNVECTFIGQAYNLPTLTTPAALIYETGRWAGWLILDNGAGIYDNGGRGIRDFRVQDCKGWGYTFSGLYLIGALGGEFTGLTHTRFTLTTTTKDWIVSGVQDMSDTSGEAHTITLSHPAHVPSYNWTDVPNNPSYSNYIQGGDIGEGYMEHSYNTLVEGGVTGIDFGVMAKNNRIICPTKIRNPTASGFGCEQNVVDMPYDRWTQAAFPFVDHTF